MYGYNINPVKATCMKYQGNCDIANFNNTCYEICAGFSGTTDPYNMDPVCTKSCDDYVEMQRVAQFGVGKCDHQSPYYPVIWDQIPHYVPKLLKDMSPEQARSVCKSMCSQYLPNLVQECHDRCDTDYNAIEQLPPSSVMEIQSMPIEKSSMSSKKSDKKIVTIVLLILLLILMFICFYKMQKR